MTSPGDRVTVPSTIACGHCSYCRAGYFAQGDNVNPGGRRAGTAPVEVSGNCRHRKYISKLLRLVTSGTVDPAQLRWSGSHRGRTAESRRVAEE